MIKIYVGTNIKNIFNFHLPVLTFRIKIKQNIFEDGIIKKFNNVFSATQLYCTYSGNQLVCLMNYK